MFGWNAKKKSHGKSSKQISDLNILKYENIRRAKKQILQLQRQITSLRQSRDFYVFIDSTECELIKLSGTIPIHYRSKQYNIPFEIWLPLNFPTNCPFCYVIPTTGMLIKRDHPYVNSYGLIKHNYLRTWKFDDSTLVELLHVLCAAFGKKPPLRTTKVRKPSVLQATTEEIKYESNGVPLNSLFDLELSFAADHNNNYKKNSDNSMAEWNRKEEKYKEQIFQLTQEVTKKRATINTEIGNYRHQILRLRQEHKERLRQEVAAKDEHIIRVNQKYNELQQKYNEQLKCSDYLTWDYLQIAVWIIHINQNKYNKYFEKLQHTLMKDGIDGSCLADLNKHDLYNLGITEFKDKNDIYNAIQDLVRKTKRMKEFEQKTLWLHKPIIKWTTLDVLQWLISLNLPNALYYKIVYEIENETQCTGADINSLTCGGDVAAAFGIKSDGMLCDKIFTDIIMFKEQSKCNVEQKEDGAIIKKDDTFEINIFSQGKCLVLSERVTKNVRIESIKEMYKKQAGVDTNANDIHFYSKLKSLQPNKTLDDVGIVDDKHLITVKFGVNGADPQQ